MDENLGLLPRVDAGVEHLVEEAVDGVDDAEADGRHAGVDLVPVVVREGDVKLALVFGPVAVCVADQGGFPLYPLRKSCSRQKRTPRHIVVAERCLGFMMEVTYVVVDVGIADSDPVAAMRDVKESVIVDLVRGKVTRKVNMIDPNVGSRVKANGIARIVQDILNLQVPKNDIACAFHSDSNAVNHYKTSQFAHNELV